MGVSIDSDTWQNGLAQKLKLHIYLPHDYKTIPRYMPQRRVCMSTKDMYKNVQSSFIVEKPKTRNNPNVCQKEKKQS